MPYEELVIQVMDRIIQLANSQVSRKMWYKVKNVTPRNPKYNGKRGRHTHNAMLTTIVIHVLRELGFEVKKKIRREGKVYQCYFLIDLDDLMSS